MSAAPALFKARAQASAVAPVVRTSSTSRMRRLLTRSRSGTLKTDRTFFRRARADGMAPWLRVRRLRTRASTAAGQFGRLVVAAQPEPGGMKRHQHDQVAIFQQRPPYPAQPAGKAGHQFQPVGMFQGQEGATAGLVIGQDGAGPGEGGRLGQAGGAEAAGPGSAGKDVPQQAQARPSRKVSCPQQSAQKPASLPTGARQARQRGGKNRSSAALTVFGAMLFQAAVMWASLRRMTPLFDFAAAARAQERARRLKGDTFLFTATAEGLADRLSAVTRHFESGLWIGDTVPEALRPFAARWSLGSFDAAERLVMDAGEHDLAVSLYSLQAVNDLPGALAQLRRALKPDGLFLAALLGGGTLKELREALAQGESLTRGGISPRVSPFADVRDLGSLLSRAGFALPVADVERLTARYGDVFALARDLRAHGFSNVLAERSRTPLRRDTLAASLAHYAEAYGVGGRLAATFETIYLTGWAPHQSQQQPLKPGSAKARLADALGTAEQSAGEKPGS